MEFGEKEKALNYACQTYQLSRSNKAGAVMALIRECQPKTINDCEKWYINNAYSSSKSSTKITKELLEELGERLYVKIKEIVIPEWTEAFSQLSLQACVNYIFNLTINRTFDGYVREKAVVEDGLEKEFLEVRFEQSDPELDHAGDIDHLCWIGERAIGIQIKPITARANFGNYSATERMKMSFEKYTERYGGKVVVVFSLNGEIANNKVLPEIKKEIETLM